MKNLIFPFSIWLLVTNCSIAQIDSVTVQSYKLNTLFWNEFNNNPIIAKQLPIADFTETSLYTSVKNQPLSVKQTPNKVQLYGFNSKGIYTLKNKFKLFGNLNFSKSYTKETAYQLFHNNTQEFSTEISPSTNYPLAIRAGNNENLHYQLKGGLTGNISKKIPFSISVNYNVAKFFGLTIPKTEQEIIDYNSMFQIGYQFEKHTLFTFLNIAKAQNNFSFTTVGITATPIDQISEPNTYTGFSVGYGDVLGFNSTLLAGLTENNTQQFGLGYNYHFKKHYLNLKYTHIQNKEHYYATPYKDENNLAALFKRTLNTIDFSYINNHNNKYVIINAQYIIGKATNTHAFENFTENTQNRIVKNNYQHNTTQSTVNITWEKRKHKLALWSTTLKAKITDNKIEDFNTTQQRIVGLQAAINISKDLFLTKKSFLSLATGFSFYTSLKNNLAYNVTNSTTSVGTSLIPPSNTFNNDVILHDFTYNTLQKGGSILNIQYQHSLKKSTLIVDANYSYLTAISPNDLFKNNQNYTLQLKLQY